MRPLCPLATRCGRMRSQFFETQIGSLWPLASDIAAQANVGFHGEAAPAAGEDCHALIRSPVVELFSRRGQALQNALSSPIVIVSPEAAAKLQSRIDPTDTDVQLPSITNTISAKPGTVFSRDQSRCNSRINCTRVAGCAPAWMMRFSPRFDRGSLWLSQYRIL